MTQLTQEQAQVRDQAVLEVATAPLANGSKTLQTLIHERYGTKLGLGQVLSKVTDDVQSVVDGDPTKLREILSTQTLVLDQIFQHYAEQSVKQRSLKGMTALMGIALRAQVMSRQTAHAITDLPVASHAKPKKPARAPKKAAHLSTVPSATAVGG